ncbi:HEPN/Toprim-associated domain-containing protein [Methylobacter sp. sgz302048]|uniref:HEPN/Toprim-associated domain-containing protein n=1 Tax=Methylobacter sp. sgz302048 TaxID=3455945 RepID=UPI003FA14272
MGTSIELCVGNVSLSYSKNFMGEDYGFLFQEDDLFRRKTDAINYDYYEEHPEEKEELAEAEELFARTLSRILPRLEILGFTLEAARAEYQAAVAEAEDISRYGGIEESKKIYLTFEEFCNLACRYPLGDLKSGYIEYETPDRDKIAQGRFAADIDKFERIPWTDNADSYWSESSFLSARVCILSAESMLQVFSLNPANSEVEVTWEFGPIVHAGWVQREAFRPGARQRQKVLIATEGASDARIIRRSLDVLRPDVADFFNFVDVDERHHFWGTGNLVKFAEGLLRIEVLNQVLFVFDNDAEGVDAFRKLEKLELPANMRAMLLPDLEEFRTFSTRGPEGVGVSDINGRAAAIECYLDLRLDQYPASQVTWSNFKKDIDAWHGVLDFKESYSKHFYDQPDDLLRNGSYDVSKLTKLIDALIKQAGLVTSVI